jgi:hypothetical protein
MKKTIPWSLLKEYGWTNVDVGKGYIVSYCETCKSQRLQFCTGRKKVPGDEMFRFVCEACYRKLNGNGGKKYGNRNGNNGPILKKTQQNYGRT